MNYEDPTKYARTLSRWAGWLYLAIIICGVWGEGLIRSGMVVSGDAATTAENVINSQGVFLVSILFDIGMVVADIAIAVVMWRLFRSAGMVMAGLATAFRLVQATLIGVSLLALWSGTALIYCDPATLGVDPATINTVALSLIELHGVGYDFALIFFAINCAITGWLIVRSGFAPAWLGRFVALCAPVYATGSMATLFAPMLSEYVQYAYAFPLVAELTFCLWLLFKGVDVQKWKTADARVSAA